MPRVHAPHGVVADAEPVDHAGPEALDHDVGASRRAAGTRRGPRRRLQVEQHALHAAVPAVRVERRHDLHARRASAAARPSRRVAP